MQLYKTFTTDKALGGVTVSWQASQTDASRARSAAKAGNCKAESQTVNVPTAKGPLIEWLNENVKS
ncbi:hypothetical protein [Rhodoferax sp.]|uniref:hypothetical protein n=1 Tax=Rhodoferax sp. TaxID=50421 RepID=UPI00277A592D|nr:hypothetical protein [Rhodoferax sp.]